MKNLILFIIATIIAGGAGFLLQKSMDQPQVKTEANKALGSQRQEFAARNLDGEMQNIKHWDGKLILLNFWATWCPPCLKEIPDFIELQETYGEQNLQIIGVAIDNEEAVREYAEKQGMNYPVLIVQEAGVELANRYGNSIGALPYSVIINRKGEISNTITGELSKKRAIEILSEHGIN